MALLKRLASDSDSRSLAVKMRRARFAFFVSLLEQVPRPLTILDVGGTEQFWHLMGGDLLADVEITLLNLEAPRVSSDRFRSVAGDARALTAFADREFDVVFSNSVIEHVGDFDEQGRMAHEVRRVGRRYFVQTPNRNFPLEPHFLFPGFQFLPLSVRTWLVMHFNVGWIPRVPNAAEARRTVEDICLLTRRQLCTLFPGASIYEERLFGLTKSFVAYDGWNAAPTRAAAAGR